MSLRFITGRSGAGKTTFVQQEIASELERQPLGTSIFVLVPDQMSFSVEHSLSVKYGLSGMIRAQISTFKRLSWRVLQETGGITRQEVDGFGYRMLVRSVLEENQDDFKLFRQAANKRGFTEQIGDLLKEFSRYCLDFTLMSELHTSLKEANAPRTLIDKAEDLALLLTKIESKLGTSFVDSEGHLALLASQIQHADFLHGADIYVDGFENFTTREYEILTELLKYGNRVTVVLPMEEDLSQHDHQLFFNPVRTYLRLRELARAESINIEEDVHLTEGLRFKKEDLAHLEKAFDSYPTIEKASDGNVSFIEATDRRAEIHAVARNIRAMMIAGKRYRDIAILYRQPEKYDELIETIFPHYDIPVFISQKKPMLHHPLIEFARSVLEIVSSGWSYESVFRAVKTDLFFPHGEDKKVWRERADRLENYVLAHGIVYESRWFDDSRWYVKKYQGLELHATVQTDEELALERELHLIRDCIREPLAAFEKQIKGAKAGRDVAEALFLFMESLHVYDKIIDLRAAEERAGRLLGAAEHEQAWNGWINVLDQFVLMFGDKEMNVAETAKILDEGLDTLEFTRIPPAIDQVTVSTIEVSSLMNIDAVFVIGVSDGVLPQRIDSEGLLSDADREWFTQIGFELAPTSKMKLMDETYMAYRAFTAPREQLVVSYPIADEEGKAIIPSLYIARIAQLLPGTETTYAVTDPSELIEDDDLYAYISHPRAALPYAAMKLRQAHKTSELSLEWQAVLAYYERDPEWASIVGRIQRPVEAGNEAERLHPEITAGLYGKSFVSSVSRVESYYSCPFQHYASYGLGLRERSEYKLEAPAIGDLFHEALKWVSDEVMRLGKSWSELTREECWSLARQAVDEITPYFFNRILLSTNRYLYIKRKLKQIIQRTIYSLNTQAKATTFKPIAIEAGFGPGEKLPALEIFLKRGETMKLRGRIDRIDATEIEGKNYIRIVDYKSSARNLDLTEVLYGLSLQMMTYMDVALEFADSLLGVDADPAGLLYMHVHNPMIRPTVELTPALLEAEIAKSYKMTGYLLEKTSVVEAMDADIGRSSSIIPAALKVDGSFTKASKVLSPSDVQMMRAYVRTRHQLAGDAMLIGDTRVLPYKLRDRMPCQFCPYRAVCQFDPTNPAQKIREYDVLAPEESLDKMRKEVDNDEVHPH